MPRVCTVCIHSERAKINEAIIAGQSERSIAKQYSVSDSAIHRHAAGHLPTALSQAATATALGESTTLLERVHELLREARDVLASAKQEHNPHLVLLAVDKASKLLELEGKVLAHLEARGGDQEQVIRIVWQTPSCQRCGSALEAETVPAVLDYTPDPTRREPH